MNGDNTREDICGEDGRQLNSVRSNPVSEGNDGTSGSVVAERVTREHQRENHDEWEDYEEETKCGIGWFHPQWLQKLASKKSYVLVYGLLGMVCDAGVGAYFGSTINTVEKRFKFPSTTTGFIGSAVDTAGIVSFIVVSYLGSRGHKTRWVAFGFLLVTISCFLRLSPHLLFGSGEDALRLTLEHGDPIEISNSSIININDTVESREFLCQSKHQEEEEEACSIDTTSAIPTTIFFIAGMVFGVGTSIYHTVGLAYLDDNVEKRKTPLLYAITQFMRMFGPTFGSFFGAYALSKYVNLSVHPTITSEDPRWIGAWWLGWIPVGLIVLAMTFVVALFPRRLPRAAQRTIAAGETLQRLNTTISFSDFKMVMIRLIKNKVVVFNSFSSVFFIIGLGSYWTFFNKYLELEYRLTASDSSLLTGSMGFVFSGLGILLSGVVLTVFKPSARYVAGWNVIVEAFELLAYLVYAFLTCGPDDFHGSRNPDSSWNLTSECNSNCDCGPSFEYSPICSSDGSISFFSPCHAGCTIEEMVNGTKMYGNCSCIGADGTGWAVPGLCPVDCGINFMTFVVIHSIVMILSSSGKAGHVLIQLRCVDPEDKAVSIGFTELLLCTLAYAPLSLIYGSLMDLTCILWDESCGVRGNCWLYDRKKLGYFFNFISAACLLLGTLLDIGVWYYVKDLQMYDEEDAVDNTKMREIIKKKSSSENQLNENLIID